MTNHPPGYTVRYVSTAGYYVLDCPGKRAAYASHTEASLWAVARKLERDKLIA